MAIPCKKCQKVILLDGSFGFQANKYVEKSIEGDPLWSAKLLVTNPEVVTQVHLDYINSGCTIIETNSYQASILGFEKYLNLNRIESFNLIRKSVDYVRLAIEKSGKNRSDITIAGSLGPYGAYLHDGSEYSGHYANIPREILIEYHKDRIEALLEGGIDLLAMETVPSRREGEILVELLKNYPQLKGWLAFSCQNDGIHTRYGDDFAESALYCYNLNPDQLVAIGVNCTAPHAVESLLKRIRTSNTNVPLIVYANSGEGYDPTKGWDNNCEKLEDFIPKWLDLGVEILGGCCRVCDNYMGKIRTAVENWQQSKN